MSHKMQSFFRVGKKLLCSSYDRKDGGWKVEFDSKPGL